MIDKNTFMNAVKNIRVCFNDNDFLKDNERFMIWYKHIKDCNAWSFEKAVDKCVTENRRTPVLADIMVPYNEIETQRKKDRDEFVRLWERICDLFPEARKYYKDKECTDKIKRMTLDKVGGDYKAAFSLGENVLQTVMAYAKEHDPYYNNMDFKEYFMGVPE